MKTHYYCTSEIAKAAGVHPNTVRKYEKWGFLPPIPRDVNGYRLFSEAHLDQMRLARMAMLDEWPGRDIRKTSLALIKLAATGELESALELAYRYLYLIKDEQQKAEEAAKLVDSWTQVTITKDPNELLNIHETAEFLGVSVDMLRHWERNGLIKIPRNPGNRYRLYGMPEIRRLRVIYMLSHAGYSTMAILRMLSQMDRGNKVDVRYVLDTPGPDEDIFYAADHRISTLAKWERQAEKMITHLKTMLSRYQYRSSGFSPAGSD
ncbi:MerR family transcriptional regulator [Chloroflexota bacterium]